MVSRSTLLAISAVLLASANAGAGHAAGSLQLPKDSAGEPCTATGMQELEGGWSVACGATSYPAGQVGFVALPQAVPKTGERRRAVILPLLLQANDNLACAAPEWLQPGDQALLLCSAKGKGWPRVLIGLANGDRLYWAEGIPAATPALEAALGAVSGMDTTAAAGAAQKVLAQKLPADAIQVSAADYAGLARHVERGRLDAEVDDFAGAESEYRQALQTESRIFGPDSMVVGETLAELALQVSNQGRFGEAAGLLRRATPIIESSASDAARVRLASYRALDAANQRDYADALKFAADAHRAASAGGAAVGQGTGLEGGENAELAHTLLVEAGMALRLGNVATARAAAEETLWIVSQDPELPLWWRPQALALMAQVNERDGRVVAAEHQFRDARDLDKTLFGDTAPTAIADFQLGEFYVHQEVYGPALEAYRAGFAILDKQPSARALVEPDQIEPYFVAASAADPSASEEMFRVGQYTNRGLVDESIARVAARQAAATPALASLAGQAENAARDRDMKRTELAAEYAKLDEDRSGERERKLEDEVQLASTRADELFGKVNQQFPRYGALVSPGPASLKEMQSRLRPGEALVSYLVGVRSSYALVVTPQGFAAQPLAAKRDDLAADIVRLREAFTPRVGKLPPFSLTASYGLYQSLLAPLEPRLAGVDRLIVVPGAVLDNLPFSLLVTEAPLPGQEHAYGQAAWLLRRMAVSQMSSPRAFLSLRASAPNGAATQQAFLGIGNPAFNGPTGPAGTSALAQLANACQGGGPISPDLLRSLPALPETVHEVKSVSAHFANPTLLLGANATEAGLRAQALDRYGVIYFATHGLLPGELHCATEASLPLSPPAERASSPEADGLLTASEIAQLRLNAGLVVLSACNTANSPVGDSGGALEGLSDAFFAAGARGVLASYWQVPSASTERLMTDLFARASGSADLAQALRQAQLALIAQPRSGHPYYWAAFSLIGEGQLHPASILAANGTEVRP